MFSFILKAVFVFFLFVSWTFAKDVLPSFDDPFWENQEKGGKSSIIQTKSRLEDSFTPFGYRVFRFLSITAGSLPFSYLVGSQAYDWSIYYQKGQNSHWRPGLWGWERGVLSYQEQNQRNWNVVSITIGTSLMVAFIDLILYYLQKES